MVLRQYYLSCWIPQDVDTAQQDQKLWNWQNKPKMERGEMGGRKLVA
jgi:hypothetical protein